MRLPLIAVCLALGALTAGDASASLGGAYDTVVADRTHLSARLNSQTVAAHQVHRLTLVNGAVRKEFAADGGPVFAISWSGRSKPDLRQLLGPYFSSFQSRTATVSGRRIRRALATRRSDLVVYSGGANGAFWGYAYLPKAAPSDFALSEMDPAKP
jgi:hypothetical protein